jgi:hypothetical protein
MILTLPACRGWVVEPMTSNAAHPPTREAPPTLLRASRFVERGAIFCIVRTRHFAIG